MLLGCPLNTYLVIPKMEPIETRQSMLLEPSRGSNETTYLPRFSVSISMTLSFSSETNRHVEYEDFSMLMKISLDSTSSFLTCSPWTLVSPEIPWLRKGKVSVGNSELLLRSFSTYSLAIPALRTAELMALMAVWMQLSSCDKSPVACLYFFCSCNTKRVSVMQLESKAGPCWVMMRIGAVNG